MTIFIKGGWLDDHMMRRARKKYSCDGWLSCDGLPQALSGHRCPNKIIPGDYYALGTLGALSGGFGVDRLCLECAGPEARASVPASQGRAAA